MNRGFVARTRIVLALGLAAILLAHAAPAGAAEKIIISATRTTGSAGAFIAFSKGYFAQEGLDVDFRFFNAGQPVAVAVASGDAAIGITGLSAGLYNMAGKQAIKIIAGGSTERAGYSNSAFIASNDAYARGLRAPKDITGRSFGLTQVGSSYHYVVTRVAAKYGFPLSSIRLVPLQSFANVLAAAIGNQVDAGLLQSNVALPAHHRGEVKFIGWAGNETTRQSTALLTSSPTARTRRDMIERFLRAYLRGAAEYDSVFQQTGRSGEGAQAVDKDAQEAKRNELLDIITKFSELPRDQVMEGVSYIDPLGRLDLDDVRNQVAVLKGLGMIDARAELDEMLDLTFLAKAQGK